jgi:hypothetical protein
VSGSSISPSLLKRSTFTWYYVFLCKFPNVARAVFLDALERECGRLIDGIHSMKVPKESLVKEYLLRELMEHRHVADPHYSNPLFRREGAANDALFAVPAR